jgi:hypothetical protein
MMVSPAVAAFNAFVMVVYWQPVEHTVNVAAADAGPTDPSTDAPAVNATMQTTNDTHLAATTALTQWRLRPRSNRIFPPLSPTNLGTT